MQEITWYIYAYIDLEGEGKHSAVGIATGYGLDGRGIGVRVPIKERLFSHPRRPYLFWGSFRLTSNGYWELFLRE
jgi:hypothetical protein